MTDFSCHRPVGYSWIDKYKEKLGIKQVVKDYETMYDWLLSKPKGWIYNLEHAKGMRETDVRDYKIKLICMFIADNHFDFEFNERFTQLRRV